VAVALSPPGRSKLPVGGVSVLGHLFFEHSLQDGFEALSDSGLHVPFPGVLKFLLRG
jgi:hypothetical protein